MNHLLIQIHKELLEHDEKIVNGKWFKHFAKEGLLMADKHMNNAEHNPSLGKCEVKP